MHGIVPSNFDSGERRARTGVTSAFLPKSG